MSEDDLHALFLRHVCQTSPAPLGITVARASGSTVWDAAGRAYLDLLAGMGVANVGHTHPEVVAAVRAQAERHLHVMVYGEFVEEAQVRLAARLAGLLPDPLEVASVLGLSSLGKVGLPLQRPSAAGVKITQLLPGQTAAASGVNFPAEEATLTMCPRPRGRIRRRASFVPRIGPCRLMST